MQRVDCGIARARAVSLCVPRSRRRERKLLQVCAGYAHESLLRLPDGRRAVAAVRATLPAAPRGRGKRRIEQLRAAKHRLEQLKAAVRLFDSCFEKTHHHIDVYSKGRRTAQSS